MLARILILLALIIPAISSAQFDISALQARFPAPTQNAGPNCYNTTLISLGYVNAQVYVNGSELEFYLNNFCEEQNISALDAPNGYIVIYREPQHLGSYLTHAASLLGNGMVFEKYNYQGQSTYPSAPEGFKGDYLYQPLSESYYFLTTEPQVQSVYSCQSEKAVKTALKKIQSKNWAKKLDLLRNALANDIASLELQDLHVYLTGIALSELSELNQILTEKTESPLEKEYLISYARSIHGQIYYSMRSYQAFCPSCFQSEQGLLNKELQKTSSLISLLAESK